MTQPSTQSATEPSAPAEPAPQSTPTPPVPGPPASAQPAAVKDAESGRGGKDAILADLAKERDARQALEGKFAKLAAALGVEEPKGKTDIEALNERIAAQEKRASDAEARALRLEVAQETKLPPALAARLTGTTRDELTADAQTLLSLISAGATPASGAPGETPVEPPKPKTPAPDPTQGAKGSTPSARPTSLNQAVQEALDSKR